MTIETEIENKLRGELSARGIHPDLHPVVLNAVKASGVMTMSAGKEMHAGSTGATLTRTPLRSPLQAAADDPQNVPLLRQIKAQASRLGFTVKDNEVISVPELNRAIAGHDPVMRMDLKAKMAQLRLIP
jgi:hypothetical protein